MGNDVGNYDVVTVWHGGMKSQTHCHAVATGQDIQSPVDHVICSDQPEAMGGKGTFPCPQELILAAFNACMTASFVSESQRNGVTLSRFEITTHAELILRADSPAQHAGGNAVRYVIYVSGSGSLQQYEHIHRRIISSSPNRWLLAQNMTVEGDLIIQ